MAKKKRPVKKRAVRKRSRIKVWHIYHFEQRFEMPDDYRKLRVNPLIYIKEYIGTGADDEQITYRQQIQRLKQHADRHTLRSVFDELRELAACRSRAYRGYLLDERLRPASTAWLAVMCGLKETEMDRILKALATIGLIERVPLPKWDLSKNDEPKTEKTKKRKTPQKGATGGKKRDFRKRAEISGNERRPLKNKDKGIDNRKSEKKEKNNPVRTKPEQGTESDGKVNLISQALGEPKVPPVTPATTPIPNPSNPNGSDAGGVGFSVEAGPSLPSIDLDRMLEELYDPTAFALQVFNRLFGREPYGLHGRKEIGTFAAAWERALQSKLKPSELKQLWDRSMQRAEQISRKRRRVDSPGAVWTFEFNKRLKAKIQPPAATG